MKAQTRSYFILVATDSVIHKLITEMYLKPGSFLILLSILNKYKSKLNYCFLLVVNPVGFTML